MFNIMNFKFGLYDWKGLKGKNSQAEHFRIGYREEIGDFATGVKLNI